MSATGFTPRPFSAELEGYAHVPRMLDKARATLAGTAGSYEFGCPVDHTCMARLGIPPELVLDLVVRHPGDRAVLAELRARGIPSAEEAWFDAQATEDELQEVGYLRVRRGADLPKHAGARLFPGASHGARVSVLLIDAEPGEGESLHAHPTEEVVVVTEGEATFFLGAHQARVVRAGEVVRIPAAEPHRYENRGEAPLRAVAAQGSAEIVREER